MNLESPDNTTIDGYEFDQETLNLILEYREKDKEYIIKTPEYPIKDSQNRDINQIGSPTFIKLIRNEATNIPTIMRSKDGYANSAELYSLVDNCWKLRPDMWQDYVYNGILGMDYIYVDDVFIKQIIKCKN